MKLIITIAFANVQQKNGVTNCLLEKLHSLFYKKKILLILVSRVAQWERAGPITQRSVDRNHALLYFFLTIFFQYRLTTN